MHSSGLHLRLGHGLVEVLSAAHLLLALVVSSVTALVTGPLLSRAHRSALGLEVLHEHHQGLNRLGLLKQVIRVHAALAPGSGVRVVGFFSYRFLLDFSHFFGLVVCDEQAAASDVYIRVGRNLLLY